MSGLELLLPGVLIMVAIYGLVLIIIDAASGGLTAHEERDQ